MIKNSFIELIIKYNYNGERVKNANSYRLQTHAYLIYSTQIKYTRKISRKCVIFRHFLLFYLFRIFFSILFSVIDVDRINLKRLFNSEQEGLKYLVETFDRNRLFSHRNVYNFTRTIFLMGKKNCTYFLPFIYFSTSCGVVVFFCIHFSPFYFLLPFLFLSPPCPFLGIFVCLYSFRR